MHLISHCLIYLCSWHLSVSSYHFYFLSLLIISHLFCPYHFIKYVPFWIQFTSFSFCLYLSISPYLFIIYLFLPVHYLYLKMLVAWWYQNEFSATRWLQIQVKLQIFLLRKKKTTSTHYINILIKSLIPTLHKILSISSSQYISQAISINLYPFIHSCLSLSLSHYLSLSHIISFSLSMCKLIHIASCLLSGLSSSLLEKELLRLHQEGAWVNYSSYTKVLNLKWLME